MSDQKVTIPFRKNVPANTSGHLDFRVPAEASIDGLNVLFYPGPQLDLQIKPIVLKKGGPSPEPMLEYPDGGLQYIAGDNNHFKFNVALPVDKNDIIRIAYTNVNTLYAYDLVVDVVLDYRAGKVSIS